MKKRVTGIGNIFLKSANPDKTKEWYHNHLGLNTDPYGCTFWWQDKEGNDCSTQWSPFKDDTTYFAPSQKEFMINFRVDDLEALQQKLKEAGVNILDEIAVYDYGKFLHILDIEDNKIELWEPIDQTFDDYPSS